ncbi:cold-regulated 413 plasma membrane protein 4 isoform X3 [Ricinus communis]|uniref:cold-regulated 413 plasma membrane protein 4 isoform X3 n=1 Tax=Ricinus communis TaxID=3988 RepID=UPI00201A4AED|nr:cold-regulated 413 plasma membrane protein 4 isoform X3 [Ricinus communis]
MALVASSNMNFGSSYSILLVVVCSSFLLILIRVGRRSALQTTLLALFLFASFPAGLFKVLRGQFGYWIAFIAIAANLYFPETFPVSHFPLFVLTPDRLAHGLRDSIASGIFCLVLAVFLLVIELRDIGGVRSCGCNIYCFFYSLAIGFLFYFTIMYLSLAIW